METFAQRLASTMERLTPSPKKQAELQTKAARELEEQKLRFQEAITCHLRSVFGRQYVRKHKPQQTVIQESITRHLELLYHQGIGAFYSTGKGGGKTHLLLEIFVRICTREWESAVASFSYPNGPQFIEKTCQYHSLDKIVEVFRSKEKLRIGRYNLIDNIGAPDVPSYVLVGLENHLEEINRQGKALVVSSLLDRHELDKISVYRGILSHCYEQCRFYKLEEQDLRLSAEVLGDPDWRVNR